MSDVAAAGITTPGADQGGADKLALFLKVFSGEVILTYERMAKIRPRIRRRVLTSGKVAQFPAIGKVTANYHARGDNVLTNTSGPHGSAYLSAVEHGEQLIAVDRLLIAPVWVSELDLLMNHYETRSEYATEIGRALATKDDEQLLQVICLAARATAGPTADHPVGRVLVDTNVDSTVATLIKAIRVAKQILMENDVPDMGLVACFRPAQYNLLVEDGTLIDKDISGEGSIAAGTIRRVMGFEMIWSNNIPSTNITGVLNQHPGSGDQNDYSGDYTDTVAVLFHPSCAGTVQLMGVRVSVTWQELHQGWLILGKQAVGHGVLRPGAAIELNKATAGSEPTNFSNLSSFPG